MQNSNHSGYTNFDGSPDLAPDAESDFQHTYRLSSSALAEIEPERWLHLASGIILAFSGLMRRGPVGLLMSALGGGLLYQGITGVNPLKLLIGVHKNMKADLDRPSTNTPQPDEMFS